MFSYSFSWTSYVLWTLLVSAFFVFKFCKKTRRRPKRWAPPRFYPEEKSRKPHISVRQDNFKVSKIPKDLDAIVIGSGIGGLTCGALLAKNGKRVLVLEQHYVAGGCTHTFEEEGFEHETGIHYVGNVAKRQKLFDLLSMTKIRWHQMGNQDWEAGKGIYDEFVVKGEKFPLRAGIGNFTADMIKSFPESEAQIRAYVTLVEDVARDDFFFNAKVIRPKCLRRLVQACCMGSFQRYNRPVIEVLREDLQISDPKLLAVLRGYHSDYGHPSESSFNMHAQVAHHYFEGGYYPVGGSAVFAEGIIPTIEKAGGRVLVRKKVQEILIHPQGHACGVRMESGLVINAPIVVSACGVRNTFGRLLPHCPEWMCDFKGLMEDVGPSIQFFYMFLGIDLPPDEARLPSSNMWVLPCDDKFDLDKLAEDFDKDPEHAAMPYFLASGSSKDPEFAERHPGKSTAVMITTGIVDRYKKFLNQKSGKRDDEYTELKEVIGERLLKEFLKHHPHLEDHIVQQSISTPATAAHYLGYEDGEVYGMNPVPKRFQAKWKIECDTAVPGLYLTGQDITTLGFTGAMMSGVLTAMVIEGYGTPLDLWHKRNIVSDLWNVEEGTCEPEQV